METISISFIDAQQYLALQDQIVDVYRQAFADAPYYRTEADVIGFAQFIPRHVQRADFRAAVALSLPENRVVGMAYGYRSGPGQWWYDVVSQALGPSRTAEWLADAFQLVELAVHPDAQGRRLGSRLHDSLLTGLPHRRAVLSTMQAETVAYRLYLRRGWVSLIEPFTFPGVSRPYRIMGLRLPFKPPPSHDLPASPG
ncbi:MAG TPA: GNAT family N-acetyltransferase [Chloroflexi bacterium]|mgnify:FL=1|jgi:GNAT superfamily N-acetyltransferase|nr:GNAT family N-acetyltransferase [Chloroflexota bacterium]HPO58572.1 GNAT family N-acetyltransferase [Anaerolineaceae bacterium]